MDVLAKRIRAIRKAARLSRPQLSLMIGIPASTIKNYEMSYRVPKADFIQAFGHAVGVLPMAWALGLNDLSEQFAIELAKDILSAHPLYKPANNNSSF